MAKKKVYGIPEGDRRDAKSMLSEWRAGKYSQNPDGSFFADNAMRVVMILLRPVGFDAGVCVRLWRNPVRPFVYDVHLLGFPAISGRQSFSMKWTHTSGEVLTMAAVPIYATADQLAVALPEKIRKLATVQGGTMAVSSDGAEVAAQTGRWFISFAQLPEYVPSFDTIPDPRIVGRVLRTDLSIADEAVAYRTISSVDGPTPIHPGSMALAWPMADGLRIGPIEPRIYQEYLGGPAFASYFWTASPFETFIFEGQTAAVSISLAAKDQDIRDGAVEISVDVAVDFATNISAEDVVGTLDDWIAAAISRRPEWSWSEGRLTLTLQPDQKENAIELQIEALEEEIIEGNQILVIRISNPLATSGVALISQNTANITIVDKNRAGFAIYGPGTVQAPADAEFVLAISGIFTPGTLVSVYLDSSGTATAADVSAWREALATYAGTLDGVSFDPGTGLLSFLIETESGIGSIPITVGVLGSAAGKNFTLSISGATVAGGAGDITSASAAISIL